MNPDWTVGIKLGRDRSGGFWVLDMVRQRANPGDVERLLLDKARRILRLPARQCELNGPNRVSLSPVSRTGVTVKTLSARTR